MRSILARLFRRRQALRDLDDELRSHLAIEQRQRIERGESPRQAANAARTDFGNPTLIAEVTREQWGLAALERLLRDVACGARALRRTPGFTVVAVLTLALGIGATTAIFSVVHSVLLRPLPFPQSERLVTVWTTAPALNLPAAFVSIANYLDWRAQNHVFEDIGITRPIASLNLTGVGTAERLEGARISETVLPVLGIPPLLGRNLTERERQTGAPVALLSYGLWVRRFGRDPTVVGRVIRLNGSPHQVIGVMPAEFRYPTDRHEIWLPLFFAPDEVQTRIGYNYLAVARLRPGVTIEKARAEMNAIAARIAQQYPAIARDQGVKTESMLDSMTGGVQKPLLTVLIGVAALLAIGCANLAGLLLARATARLREISLRMALGASRARLVLQLTAEVLPLALLGTVLGILFARVMLDRVLPWLPPDMPRLDTIALHGPALAVGILASLVTVLAAALVPALSVSRERLRLSQRYALRNGLVILQIGFAVALLVVCGLMLRSLERVHRVQPGFSSEGVLTMHLAIPRTRYPRDADVAAYCGRLLDAVKSIPGTQSAGLVNRLPLTGIAQTGPLEFEGVQRPEDRRLDSIDWRTATPDYFRALGIPLIRGRLFRESDDERAKPVGIIDDRLARELYGTRDPIGRRFRIRFASITGPWIEIVGVVGHVRHDSLETDPRSQVYWNYRQRAQDRMVLVVRTAGDAASLTAAVIRRIHDVDAEQPVYDVRTMQQWRDRVLRQRYLTTGVITAFGLASLLLAMLGVYGVVSYSVSTRTREFGIRTAIGATAGRVQALVLRDALRLAVSGIIAGAALAVPAAAFIRSLLFGVSVTDTLVLAATPILLLVTTIAAGFLPARRAVRVEPMTALRHE